MMICSMTVLAAAVAVACGGDCPVVERGERLEVSMEKIRERSIPDHSVVAMTVDMPKAVQTMRKPELYWHRSLETTVLDFVKKTKGPLPDRLPVDTANLPPGDYCGRVAGNGWYGFLFHIRGDVPPVSLRSAARQKTDGLSWAMTNDVDSIRIRAQAPKGRLAVLFLDPVGDGRTVYRVAFRADGSHADARAVDDNTNNDRFALFGDWTSHAEAKVAADGGTWTLEAAIPFGAFPNLASAGKGVWRVRMSADERVTPPRDYARVPVPFDPAHRHAWDVPGFKAQAAKGADGLALRVTAVLRNQTKEFRIAKVGLVLKTRDGRELDRTVKTVGFRAGRANPISATLGAGKIRNDETYAVSLEAHSAEGALIIVSGREAKVAYRPLSIVLDEPCYRDNVYETMKLARLRGRILAEEGLGRPAQVVLEGPGTRETFAIAHLAPTNAFVFPFRDKPKGDYFLRIGETVRRVRNLPYQPGEIWIDADGVIRREGEKMFPFGFYGESYRLMYPGITVSQTYSWNNTDTNQLTRKTERAHAAGCGLIIHATQSFSAVLRDKLFGEKASQGEFDAAPYGEERRKVLERFCAHMRNRRGVFCHYLVDEPEGSDRNPDFYRRMHEIVAEADPYHPTMIVNFQDDGIRRFRDCGDILCPDTYPVYLEDGGVLGSRLSAYRRSSCAVRYGRAAMFTPQVFDWNYKAPGRVTCAPKYADIRQQCLTALAAGVKGLLLFSRFSWSTPTEHLRLGPELVIREILESKDVYLGSSEVLSAKTEPKAKEFLAVRKSDGRESLVLAFNADPVPVRFEIRDAKLPARLYVGGEKAPVGAKGGVLADTLAPRELKVYHSVPKQFSFAAAAARVEAAERARRKPGNLLTAPRFLTWGELARAAKGQLELAFPRMSVSSAQQTAECALPHGYFLQDGFADEFPYERYHCWQPTEKDAAPTVRVEFGKRRSVARMVFTRVRTEDGRYPVRALAVEANGRRLAAGAFSSGRLELTFPATEASEFAVRVTDFDRKVGCGWLSEIEAYAK